MAGTIGIRTFLPAEWKRYREIRLRALEDSPEAFGSTYGESLEYPDEAWVARLRDAAPETDYPMAATLDGELMGLAWAKIERPQTAVAHL